VRCLGYGDLGIILDDIVVGLREEAGEEGWDVYGERGPDEGREELGGQNSLIMVICAIGPHTLAGHHLRKRYAAIRRAAELTIVAFWDQDAILPEEGARESGSLDVGHGKNKMGVIKRGQ
jgi:hypothetical protein